MPSVEGKMYNMINATKESYFNELKETHEKRNKLKDNQAIQYAHLTGKIEAIHMILRSLEMMKH